MRADGPAGPELSLSGFSRYGIPFDVVLAGRLRGGSAGNPDGGIFLTAVAKGPGRITLDFPCQVVYVTKGRWLPR